MQQGRKDLERLAAPLNASGWIVGIVAMGGIAMFTALGSRVLPAALGVPGWSAGSVPTTPFLLSIAIVALAWRRSVELRKSAVDRIKAEKRAHHLAYKDDVTGLFNRRYLTEILGEVGGTPCLTLLLLDVDHFKQVNDLYGHAAGDELLLVLSQRMQAVAPEDACCARLGGDEFAMLLLGESATAELASKTAGRLLDELNKPVHLAACVTRIGASVGLSRMEASTGAAQSLLRTSDIAMYEAKRQGRNCCVWFNDEMERKLNERNLVEAEMRTSIGEGRFIPYFQPMLQLSSGEINGFEVLARWNHPTRGLVEPDEFISVAEATGMIADLSFSVMRAALIRALKWPSHLTIAVNVSPVQFQDPLLAQRIIKLLHETGFPAARLELEITESAILEDRHLALATVQSLKNYGVRISLDDFGTGYASLSQLRELPFDRIKIDKSFVASLMEDKQSNAIVHAIATLGRSLNLPITAEGVETETVHQRLQELGCSDAQGWLFGKAISGEQAGETFFNLPLDALPQISEQSVEGPTRDRRAYLRRGAK